MIDFDDAGIFNIGRKVNTRAFSLFRLHLKSSQRGGDRTLALGLSARRTTS